jgi:ABC-type molybdate transport system ATPase subunit
MSINKKEYNETKKEILELMEKMEDCLEIPLENMIFDFQEIKVVAHSVVKGLIEEYRHEVIHTL